MKALTMITKMDTHHILHLKFVLNLKYRLKIFLQK